MKTRILSFLIMALGLMVSTSAFAQPEVPAGTSATKKALDGSTVSYSVNDLGVGATYHWELSGGSLTTGVLADTDNEVSIVWNDATAGTTYYLDVYAIDATGCYSEMKRLEIKIDKATIDIDASQLLVTCSWVDGALAPDGKSGNTNTSLDIFTVNTTSDGGITPASITYEIYDGTTLVDTRTASVALTDGSFDVAIDDVFVNTGSIDKNYTIKLKDATDGASTTNPMDVGTTVATVTVHPIPVISFN